MPPAHDSLTTATTSAAVATLDASSLPVSPAGVSQVPDATPGDMPCDRRNYPLRGLPPDSLRRREWQRLADMLDIPLSEFIRWTCDLHVRVRRGEISLSDISEVMSAQCSRAFIICDPVSGRVARKSRTIPTSAPLDFCIFIVDDATYNMSTIGEPVNARRISKTSLRAWRECCANASATNARKGQNRNEKSRIQKSDE